MHRIATHPATATAGILAGALLLIFAGILASEDQGHYNACLAQHQSPAYCRLAISGR